MGKTFYAYQIVWYWCKIDIDNHRPPRLAMVLENRPGEWDEHNVRGTKVLIFSSHSVMHILDTGLFTLDELALKALEVC